MNDHSGDGPPPIARGSVASPGPDPPDPHPADLRVVLHDPERTFGLTLRKAGCGLTDAPTEPDGTLIAPAESWIRLVSGRLAPEHTPPGVEMTGPVDLDTLRSVFPGY